MRSIRFSCSRERTSIYRSDYVLDSDKFSLIPRQFASLVMRRFDSSVARSIQRSMRIFMRS
jgi:hypothetical protein